MALNSARKKEVNQKALLPRNFPAYFMWHFWVLFCYSVVVVSIFLDFPIIVLYTVKAL